MPLQSLQRDDDLEYFCNRCNTLEQENIALCKRLEKLERENTQLKEEIMSIKDTVSALIARNIKHKI